MKLNYDFTDSIRAFLEARIDYFDAHCEYCLKKKILEIIDEVDETIERILPIIALASGLIQKTSH